MTDCLQLVDEKKRFHPESSDCLKKWEDGRDIGTKYRVVAVFGSQSSGKSTLLNALFGTAFATMGAEVRSQTTRGIWMGHSRQLVCKNDTETNDTAAQEVVKEYIVLDVEGSDGAERGEDKDFERKAALFALATSEIVVVNMWENQVGLYQGNNLGLLKTVFEVDLALFGVGGPQDDQHSEDGKQYRKQHKVLLLFVIRDFSGRTSLESLEQTLRGQMEGIWDELGKPKELLDAKLSDFFDFKFQKMGHKLFRAEEFETDVTDLGDKISQCSKEYHCGLPLDGWSYYAEGCWEQIENNKDLDLPTQQTLVAKYKTEEIANNAYDKFCRDIAPIAAAVAEPDGTVPVEQLLSLRHDCLVKGYDLFAARYVKAVYEEKRSELKDKVQSKVDEIIADYLKRFKANQLEEFKYLCAGSSGKDGNMQFIERVETARQKVIRNAEAELADFTSNELMTLSLQEKYMERFYEDIDAVVSQLREKEMNSIMWKTRKEIMSNTQDKIIQLLSRPKNGELWSHVMNSFETAFDNSVAKFKTNPDVSCDFYLGYDEKKNQELYKRLRGIAWGILYEIVHQYLKEDNVVGILRAAFESKFAYDEYDVPKLWRNEHEVDEAFRLSREYAMQVLHILAVAQIDGVEIVPDVAPILSARLDGAEPNEDEQEELNFAHVLDAVQREKIYQQFKRFANFSVVDAKRSTIRSTYHIPPWIYVLIAVLGWNEFMMVIRNPLFITLLLLFGAAFYMIHKLNLWGPLITFTSAAIGETKQSVKAKLRSLLLEENNKMPNGGGNIGNHNSNNSSSSSSSSNSSNSSSKNNSAGTERVGESPAQESFEMKDLSLESSK